LHGDRIKQNDKFLLSQNVVFFNNLIKCFRQKPLRSGILATSLASWTDDHASGIGGFRLRRRLTNWWLCAS